MLTQLKLSALGLLAACVLTSCSGYQRDFRRAAITKPAPTPTGAWKGTWKSEVNGHHGPLWCLVTRDPAAPNDYQFRYRAGWGFLQFGDYTHPVTSRWRNQALPLDHVMSLPGNLGTYRVVGKVTPTAFTASYESQHDHGFMTLTRPQ